MAVSPLFVALAVMAAVAPGMASAGDETVVATARAKLPTAEETAKAQADAKAKAGNVKSATTQDQIVAWLANAPPLDRDGQPGRLRDEEQAGPRQMHGEAGVSIGTGGYRSAYVSTLIPVGKDGTLGLAYSQTDFGKNGGFGYGGYGYGGYGYGYGHRGYARGGSRQQVAVSLDMGNGERKTPESCAPGFRDGERYIEPLWVARMHGGTACDGGDAY